MFRGIRRLQETFNNRKSPGQLEDAVEPDKLEADDIMVEEALVSQISNLEELVNKRTLELEEAKTQLQHLANTADSPQPTVEELSQLIPTAGGSGKAKDEIQVDELFTKPNQAESKVAIPAGDKPVAEENKLNAVVTETGKEEKKSEPAVEEKSDAAADYFSYEEEEANPLSGLIASLPDINAEGLLQEAREVEKLVREWRKE